MISLRDFLWVISTITSLKITLKIKIQLFCFLLWLELLERTVFYLVSLSIRPTYRSKKYSPSSSDEVSSVRRI